MPNLVDPTTASSFEFAVPSRISDKIRVDGPDSIIVTELFGRAAARTEGPQAFVVDMPPASFNAAHFHPVDQFQIFFGARGAWYQRSDVDDVLVHYTDAYSTYGPFGTRGPDHLRFYTLRARASVVTGFMPQDRDKLIQRGRRNHHVALGGLRHEVGSGESAVVDRLFDDDDGLAASLITVAPDSEVTAPVSGGAQAGQFWCIVRGAARSDGNELGPGTLIWREPGEPAPGLVSAKGQAQVVVLQFPRPTAPLNDEDADADIVSL